MQPLGNHHRTLPVGRVVHVVRIFDGHSLALAGGRRIDSREAVTEIVEHPQCLQIVGRRHMLRLLSHLEVIDDAIGGRIDHIHTVAARIGDINAPRKISDHRA